MFSTMRGLRPAIGRRFQSHASTGAPKASNFTNKYHFNIDPPQVHQYWNYRNGSILFLFSPLFLGVAYLAQYTGANLGSWEGLLGFADGEHSPLKQIKFGEAQTPKE